MHNLWESMQNNASSSRAILSLAYPVTLVGNAHKDPLCRLPAFLPDCLPACLLASVARGDKRRNEN
jgi:hypothetical protein